MKTSTLVLAMAFALPAFASTPKEQLTADNKAAADRYTADKKICADEKDSAARMQCLRDAKAVNDKAVADAKARYAAAQGPCTDCGKISKVDVVEKKGESNAAGMLVGGAAGAILGHQVGGGTGRDIATVAGAVGGAYAGKKAQEKMNTTKVWQVHVDYDNGTKATVNFDKDPGMAAGDRVKKNGNSVSKF